MTPRRLTAVEKALVRRLAPKASDAAIDSLRANGRCICGCYSIGFEREAATAHCAGDAEAYDRDGGTLLISFVTNEDESQAGYLEVQRPDGELVQLVPDAANLTVLRTSNWGATSSDP